MTSNRHKFDHTGNYTPVEDGNGVTIGSIPASGDLSRAYVNRQHPLMVGRSPKEQLGVLTKAVADAAKGQGSARFPRPGTPALIKPGVVLEAFPDVIDKTPMPVVGDNTYQQRRTAPFFIDPAAPPGMTIQVITPYAVIDVDYPIEDYAGFSHVPVLMRKAASETGGAIGDASSSPLDLYPDQGISGGAQNMAEVSQLYFECMQPALTSAGQVSGEFVVQWADIADNGNNSDITLAANTSTGVVTATSTPVWSSMRMVFTLPADGVYRGGFVNLAYFSQLLGRCIPGRALTRGAKTSKAPSAAPSLPIRPYFSGLGSNTNFQAAVTAIGPGVTHYQKFLAYATDDFGKLNYRPA